MPPIHFINQLFAYEGLPWTVLFIDHCIDYHPHNYKSIQEGDVYRILKNVDE